jgi:hypothetical protein
VVVRQRRLQVDVWVRGADRLRRDAHQAHDQQQGRQGAPRARMIESETGHCW